MEYKNRIPELIGSDKIAIDNVVIIVSQLLKETMDRHGLNNIIKSEVSVEDTPFILTFEKNGSFTDTKLEEAYDRGFNDGKRKGYADAEMDEWYRQ